MASLHDGRVAVHLTVRMAWWVTPYLCTVALFLRSIAPFFDGDDERIGAFIDRQAEFIARRGVWVYCGERRV